MKCYIKYFNDFGLSVYFCKQGFDLVLLFITISIDYKNKENEHA